MDILRFITAGSVDDGKSTLIGRLLYDSKSILIDQLEAIEKQSKNKVSKPFVASSDNGLDKHWENFVSVVRSRKMEELHCSIQAGAHVATVAQMGNIAFRSGKKLEWDAAKERFTDEDINKQYMMKEYHNGYKLPTV